MVAPLPELVAVAWLKSIPGNPLGSAVATTLPPPDASGVLSWLSTGFTTVQGVSPGSLGDHMPTRESVLQLDFYAAPPVTGSGRPPWNKAAKLWSLIHAATYAFQDVPRLLVLPAATPAYSNARVKVARLLGDPQRMSSDEGSYAHYQCDLQLFWNEVL
jgi:hypothetical protein